MIVGRGKYLFSDAVLTVLVYIVIVRRLWISLSHPSNLFTLQPLHSSTFSEIFIVDI